MKRGSRVAADRSGSLLAVRNPGRISVMERVRQPDSGEYEYRCVCRCNDDGTFVAYDKEIDMDAVALTITRLETLEAEPGALDPTSMPALSDLNEIDEASASAKVLALCFYADFMRYALGKKAEIMPVLKLDNATPFDFRPLRPALETLLKLDWSEMARDYIAVALPFFENMFAKEQPTKDVYVGNAGYVLRMMADLADRMGDLNSGARALEMSLLVAPNQKKLSRLVFAYEKLEDHARLKNRLQTYQQKFGLTDRMKVIKAKMQSKSGQK